MSPQLRTRRDGSTQPSRHRAVQPGVVLWLTVVWLLVWGDLTPLLAVSGVLVAVLVCLVFPLPPLRFSSRVHPWHVVVLLARFLIDVVRASLQVAWVTLRPGAPPRNGIVRVDLASSSDFTLTGVALMVSLVPGSVLVEVRRSTHTMYLHVLDVRDAHGVERARRTVLAQEQRILRAFSPREEIAL